VEYIIYCLRENYASIKHDCIILQQQPITSTNKNLTMLFKRTLAAKRHHGFVLLFKSNYMTIDIIATVDKRRAEWKIDRIISPTRAVQYIMLHKISTRNAGYSEANFCAFSRTWRDRCVLSCL